MPFSLFLIFSRDIKYHRNYYCISKSKRRKWQNVNYFSFWVSSYYLKDLDFIPVSVLLFESIISHYTMLKIFGPDLPINIYQFKWTNAKRFSRLLLFYNCLYQHLCEHYSLWIKEKFELWIERNLNDGFMEWLFIFYAMIYGVIILELYRFKLKIIKV